MTPSSSDRELSAKIRAENISLNDLNPSDGFRLMLDFYLQVRAKGCTGPSDRDMLLFQWGTYDWGQGLHFELDFTRQFIMEGADPDDDITSQLHLTFYYQPTSQFADLKSGNFWCNSAEEADQFNSFVSKSSSYLTAASIKPEKCHLRYGLV